MYTQRLQINALENQTGSKEDELQNLIYMFITVIDLILQKDQSTKIICLTTLGDIATEMANYTYLAVL